MGRLRWISDRSTCQLLQRECRHKEVHREAGLLCVLALGTTRPKNEDEDKKQKAVLITSAAMPAYMGRIFTGALLALRFAAKTMGAKPVASVFVGLIAQHQEAVLSDNAAGKARRAGRKLVNAIS